MKKLSDPVQKVNAQSIGLDVHKGVTVFCVLDGEGHTVEEGQFLSTPPKFAEFIEQRLKAGATHVTFEASRSSLWVHGFMRKYLDHEFVHVAQSKRIRAIANSNQKSDSNDAWWLAYLTYEGRLPESHVPGAAILDLRIATRERTVHVRHRTSVINRLKAHLAQVGLVVPGSSIRTVKARCFLAEKAQELEGVRGGALRGCLEDLEYQDLAITKWDGVIDDLCTGLPSVQLIADEIPGVGLTLAATIVAEAGDIRRFHSAKAFGCATGLTASNHSTSGKTRHGAITRAGSPYLRWAMTQAAMGCLRARTYPGLAVGNWIRAKQKRMGNRSRARAAGGRKLAEAIWRLFNLGECFDATHSFGGRTEA